MAVVPTLVLLTNVPRLTTVAEPTPLNRRIGPLPVAVNVLLGLMVSTLSLSRKMDPSDQVLAPPRVRDRPARNLLSVPENVAPPLARTRPLPANVPDVQLRRLFTVRLFDPVIVPPLKSNCSIVMG